MYLTIIDGNVGFKHPTLSNILPTDVEISDENYSKFFELQAQGINHKLKNINGLTFDDIFEKITAPLPSDVEIEVAGIMAKLQELDLVLTRAQEDTWVALGVDETKLPQIWQDRLNQKRDLRTKLQKLIVV